jgi:predicted alpha/beta hydrolase
MAAISIPRSELATQVIRQWRRWCMHPEYALGDGDEVRAQFASVTTPITALSFTDDEMMSDANTTSIHSFYTCAPRKMLRLSPQDVGVARIGHFGFFRAEMKEPLWDGLVAAELVSRA